MHTKLFLQRIINDLISLFHGPSLLSTTPNVTIESHFLETFPDLKKLQWHTFSYWLQTANACYNYVRYLSNFKMLIWYQLFLQYHWQTKTRHCIFEKFNT